MAGIPANLWPEVYMAIKYLLNQFLIWYLQWKTPFKIIIGYKLLISYLHAYKCKIYIFRPPIKIPKKEWLQPYTHIGFLVGYDLRNIY